MMKHKTTANIMVMLECPPAAELRQNIGDVKSTVLGQNAKQQRDDLIDWVDEQGLSNQLVGMDEPIGANLLRVEGTPALATALKSAPNILCVALVDDFQLTILDA